MKNHPTKKSPGINGFNSEFHQMSKEELTSILYKVFQNIDEEGTLPNSFHDSSTILMPKSDKDITTKIPC